MSLSVNFNTHSKALLSTYHSVLNSDVETSWVIYGYDKGNNDLKVLEKGAGGLEELVEEFNDGKIQYAFVRVIDPNTGLAKFVLIGWCGEGVPEIKKGLFNSHFNEVSKFLKGYHLQINARSEADVDPDYIMKRINESGGSKYSINKEKPRKENPILPVHSVYEPVKIPDITALQRQSSREQIKPVGSVYQPVQLPKPKPLGTRSTWTTPAEESIPPGPSPAELKVHREHELAEKERERVEREKKERERIEREEEERERIEREEEERLEKERLEAEEAEEAAYRKQDRIRHERELQRQREIEEERSRKAKEDQERMEMVRREKEEREKREREEEEERQRLGFEHEQELLRQQEAERLQLEQEQQLAQTTEVSAEPVGSITAVVQFTYDASEDNEMSLIEGEIIRDIVQIDEGWWKGVSEDGTRTGLFPANYVDVVENAAPEQPVEDVQEVEAEPVQQTFDSVQGGNTAKAIYDYEAGEGNEISFPDGAIITDIEFVSDDWWQGKAPDGKVGLFPANYVELL